MANLLKRSILLPVMLAIAAGPSAARADSAANARAEAKRHFDRATELNKDGQVAEAVIELKRCYELAPHHTVLYDLGEAYITLAKPVEAVWALRRYLEEGGTAIKPSRRAEVELEIARQKARIATLEIRGLPGGARVRVDGVEVGTAPLGRLISVGIGDHAVSATAEGYDPAEVQVTVAGEDRRTIALTMKPRSLQPSCAPGYHEGGAGICVASGFCSAGYHSDGSGTCVAVGCALGYLLVKAECVLALKSVSSGGIHACGLMTDGTISCWGDKSWGATTPPPGTFASVSAGRYHTCGLNTKGIVACWGRNKEGQATPPAGTFVAVSAGYWHTCGIRSDSTIACWGHNGAGQATPPAGTFASVSAGEHHTCGVRSDGAIICWGYNNDGRATPPFGTFASVSASQYHTCGVRSDGTPICWGNNRDGRARPPLARFASLSAGECHTCGVKIDGSIVCWGRNKEGQATPPPGTFVSVSAGEYRTCGVKIDGSVVCWGDNSD